MGINVKQANDTLFGNLKKKVKDTNLAKERTLKKKKISEKSTTPNSSLNKEKPRWETLHSVLVRMQEENKDALDSLTNQIMRSRNSKGCERITTNTLIRALISSFLKHRDKLNTNNIDDEEELLNRINRMFKS